MSNHRGYTQSLKMKPLQRKNVRTKRPLRKQQNSLAATQGSGTHETQGLGQSRQGSTSLIQYLFETSFIDDFYTSDLLLALQKWHSLPPPNSRSTRLPCPTFQNQLDNFTIRYGALKFILSFKHTLYLNLSTEHLSTMACKIQLIITSGRCWPVACLALWLAQLIIYLLAMSTPNGLTNRPISLWQKPFGINFRLYLVKQEYKDSSIFFIRLFKQLKIFSLLSNSSTNSPNLVSISPTPFVPCCFLCNFQMTSLVLHPLSHRLRKMVISIPITSPRPSQLTSTFVLLDDHFPPRYQRYPENPSFQ